MIVRLSEIPEVAPALAAAHAREWGHLYHPADWSESVALAEFLAEAPAVAIPVTLVLRAGDGALMGSVSLVLDDFPGRPDLNPWIASLHVFPAFRRQGHARTLVRAALAHLHRSGCAEAFLFTESADGLFTGLGFAAFARSVANGHAVTLMRWSAGGGPPRAGDHV